MTCRELIDSLPAYRDGQLAPNQKDAFEEHLACCDKCANYLKAYEATVALGKEAFVDPDAPVSPDIPEDLVQAILAGRRKS